MTLVESYATLLSQNSLKTTRTVGYTVELIVALFRIYSYEMNKFEIYVPENPSVTFETVTLGSFLNFQIMINFDAAY